MKCPSGFVIPEDLNSTDNWYPNRTLSPCALECSDNFILYTKSEWNILHNLYSAFTYIGFTCLFIAGFFRFIDKKRKISMEGWVFDFVLTILFIIKLVDMVVMNLPLDQRLCRNNANWLNETDGFTGCAVQTHISTFGNGVILLSWCFLAIYLYFKIVRGWKMERLLGFRYHLSILLSLTPLILSGNVVLPRYSGMETYFNCRPSHLRKMYPQKAVVYCLVVIGLICMCLVISRVISIALYAYFNGLAAFNTSLYSDSSDVTYRTNQSRIGDYTSYSVPELRDVLEGKMRLKGTFIDGVNGDNVNNPNRELDYECPAPNEGNSGENDVGHPSVKDGSIQSPVQGMEACDGDRDENMVIAGAGAWENMPAALLPRPEAVARAPKQPSAPLIPVIEELARRPRNSNPRTSSISTNSMSSIPLCLGSFLSLDRYLARVAPHPVSVESTPETITTPELTLAPYPPAIKSELNSNGKLLRALRIPVLLALFFFLMYAPILWFSMFEPSKAEEDESIVEWGQCILANHHSDHKGEDYWIVKCGPHPSTRPRLEMRNTWLVISWCFPIFLLVVCLPRIYRLLKLDRIRVARIGCG